MTPKSRSQPHYGWSMKNLCVKNVVDIEKHYQNTGPEMTIWWWYTGASTKFNSDFCWINKKHAWTYVSRLFFFPGMIFRRYGSVVVESEFGSLNRRRSKQMIGNQWHKNISWWISWPSRWFWLELGWYRNLWHIFGEEKTHETHETFCTS